MQYKVLYFLKKFVAVFKNRLCSYPIPQETSPLTIDPIRSVTGNLFEADKP